VTYISSIHKKRSKITGILLSSEPTMSSLYGRILSDLIEEYSNLEEEEQNEFNLKICTDNPYFV
jgi:hypothetical protein